MSDTFDHGLDALNRMLAGEDDDFDCHYDDFTTVLEDYADNSEEKKKVDEK